MQKCDGYSIINVERLYTLSKEKVREKQDMERFIMKELIKWKDSKTRKPLILRGARQVRENIYIEAVWK